MSLQRFVPRYNLHHQFVTNRRTRLNCLGSRGVRHISGKLHTMVERVRVEHVAGAGDDLDVTAARAQLGDPGVEIHTSYDL